MKSFISFSVLFILGISLLTSCGEEDSVNSSNSDTQKELTTKPSANSGTEVDALREEQINQKRDSVEQVKTAVSPFLSEGCCAEEEKKAKPCCCEAVYSSYKSMLEAKKDVVEIGMTDPILAGCRELMPSEFDKLENPPSEEPDELDDLFN